MDNNDAIIDACIELIGVIELMIGLITILFVPLFHFFHIIHKPAPVLLFVAVSALISASSGYGVLNYKNWARLLLIFFSGYVILLKGLLYFGVITFTGMIITAPPPHIKDMISLFYHIAVIFFLSSEKPASRFKRISAP